ncbi:TPA: MarR family winged helix-turn-helix transcriptional regulator, partial [Streptococcus pyogenes]
QISDEIAKKYDVEHLAGPQGYVLVFLAKHQNQEIFVKDIEKQLRISKSVASHLVKRMVKNGFINVMPSQVDKRYKQVVLAQVGRDKLPLLRECRKDIEHYFLKEITKEELLTAKKVIEQLKQNMLTYKGDNDA